MGRGRRSELPPAREWLLGNQFCRKFLSGLTAPGATGKSATRLVQYMSLATGRELVGQHVFKQTKVLVVSMEDDRDELRRRIRPRAFTMAFRATHSRAGCIAGRRRVSSLPR